MKRILWISRHEPLPAQREELRRLFGEHELLRYAHRVRDADEVAKLVEVSEADEVVVVLPLTIVKRLAERGIKPIVAVMKEVEDEVFDRDRDYVEPKTGKHYRFSHFERVISVEVKTEPLE